MTPFVVDKQIERREVLHGSIWHSMPVTVVADDGEILAVRLDPGSPFTLPRHPFGPHPWSHLDAWADTTVLQLYREDDWYSVWQMFDDDHRVGAYVNFEAPVQRGPDWIATEDYGMDIVIAADGSWSWKDVDDVEEQVAQGRITDVTADHVRAEAAALATQLDADVRWWSAWDTWAPWDA